MTELEEKELHFSDELASTKSKLVELLQAAFTEVAYSVAKVGAISIKDAASGAEPSQQRRLSFKAAGNAVGVMSRLTRGMNTAGRVNADADDSPPPGASLTCRRSMLSIVSGEDDP